MPVLQYGSLAVVKACLQPRILDGGFIVNTTHELFKHKTLSKLLQALPPQIFPRTNCSNGPNNGTHPCVLGSCSMLVYCSLTLECVKQCFPQPANQFKWKPRRHLCHLERSHPNFPQPQGRRSYISAVARALEGGWVGANGSSNPVRIALAYHGLHTAHFGRGVCVFGQEKKPCRPEKASQSFRQFDNTAKHPLSPR